MKKPFALTQPAKSLAPVAFAIALAGCSMAPKYDRPPAPIDIVYRARPMQNRRKRRQRPQSRTRPISAGEISSATRCCNN